MIYGGGTLDPGPPGIAQFAPRGGAGMGAIPDLSSIGIAQLTQLANTQNPALRAAIVQEIARRGASGTPIDMASSGIMRSPLSNVASGAATAPGQQAPVVPASAPPNPAMQGSAASNPALHAIATGTMAGNAAASMIPSSVDQGVPSSNAVVNPALAAASAASPDITASIGALMKNVPTSLTPQQAWLAAAKGFGAMAASRQPGFFGALGEGTQAAADALTAANDQAIKNRMFGVDTGLRTAGLQEQQRAALVGEGQGATRLDIAKGELQNAQAQLQLEQQKYQQGFSSDQALKLAQIRAEQAQAGYLAAETGNVGRQTIQTDQGLMNVQGGNSQPIMGPNGQPVNQQWRPTATMDKYSIISSTLGPQVAASVMAGQRPLTPKEIEDTATLSATRAVTAQQALGAQAQQIYQDTYTQTKAILMSGAQPMVPSAGISGGASTSNALPAPKTQQEYNAIPKGQQYIDTDGSTKIKG